MNNFAIRIEVPQGRVKDILDRLQEAQETIRDCYDELEQLGVLTISGATKPKGSDPNGSL